MAAGVPETTARQGMVLLGVVALASTLLHAGLAVAALTAGHTSGATTEALRVMRYTSPLLAVLSFCAAALAFSGRTAARRPGLAGATFLMLALVCATVLTGCAILPARHAGWWALYWAAINTPLVAVLAVCRRVFRSAQRE